MKSSERLNSIDIAKGIAIFLVVLGHAIQYNVKDFDGDLIFRAIYATHMPLFMFISGYVSTGYMELKEIKPLTEIFEYFKRLVIPFLAWIPINYFAIKLFQNQNFEEISFVYFLINLTRSPDAGGLWFLLVLFECHLLLILSKIISSRWLVFVNLGMLFLINAIVFLNDEFGWMGIGFLRWYYLFFLAGFFLKKNKPKNIGVFGLFCVVTTYWVLVLYWYRKEFPLIDYFLPEFPSKYKRILVQAYHVMTASLGIGLIVAISSKLDAIKWFAGAPKAIGMLTLEIYAGHYIFLYICHGLMVSNNIFMPSFIQVSVVTIIALLGAIEVSNALRHSPLLYRILYGRKINS